jgi:hypothetical protein
MMVTVIRRLLAVTILSASLFVSQAQPEMTAVATENKPYKLLTSGKQITIKSSKQIKHVMLWTTGGNRVVEQREINNNSFVVNIPVNQKTFFLMIGLSDGKIYTEKIGLRE